MELCKRIRVSSVAVESPRKGEFEGTICIVVCVCVEIMLTASHSGCCFGFVVCTVNVAPSSRKLPSSIKLVVRELLIVMCPVKRCASKLHWVTGLMVMWSLMSSDVGLTY